jgi:rod shape-determining protein MreD
MLDVVSRHAFPFVQSVLVVLVLGAPFGLPGQAQLQWAWAVSSVFFWSLYRPGAMPALLVFVLGVLLDLLAQ